MVWLQTAEGNGNGLYLDIHHIEQQQEEWGCRYAISGMLGDGHSEGEVLVEVAACVEVTFVDEWLPGGRLPAFLAEVGREETVAALAEAAAEMVFCVESFPVLSEWPRRQVTGYRTDGRWLALRPRPYGEELELPIGVADLPAVWQQSAA